MSTHREMRTDELDIDLQLPAAVLDALLEAFTVAKRKHRPVWRLAGRWAVFHWRGLTVPQVRALLTSGYLWHQPPAGREGRRQRPSRRAEEFIPDDDTLLALTPRGVAMARRQRRFLERAQHLKPFWDAPRHRLSWEEALVLVLRHDAPDQGKVLDQFQARDWCPCLEHVFDRQGKRRGKQQLHDAIYRLNHHQHEYHRIRFRADGHCRVWWEHIIFSE